MPSYLDTVRTGHINWCDMTVCVRMKRLRPDQTWDRKGFPSSRNEIALGFGAVFIMKQPQQQTGASGGSAGQSRSICCNRRTGGTALDTVISSSSSSSRNWLMLTHQQHDVLSSQAGPLSAAVGKLW